MQLYRFSIKASLLDEAIQAIEEQGGIVLFSSEVEKEGEIYAQMPEGAVIEGIEGTPAELPSIDWEGQWQLHGINELTVGDQQIQLIAGPGFGDFSHPTTQLMIAMMQEHLSGDLVIDVGCGSGILSMAAIALGAKKVIGIDIDPEALRHSSENAQENGYQKRCSFCLPHDFQPKGKMFVLMNMISSEQKEAWKCVQDGEISGLITSGILMEEREDYLTGLKGWKLEDEKEKEGWVCFYLTRSHSKNS